MVNEKETERKEQTATHSDEGDKPKADDPIERANKAAERLERANSERKSTIREAKELEAKRILGGDTQAGQSSEKKVEITAEEYSANILKGIIGKNPVKVRRGIINPSFYVSIVKDTERSEEWLYVIRREKNRDELLTAGIPQLTDMFEDTVLKLKA